MDDQDQMWEYIDLVGSRYVDGEGTLPDGQANSTNNYDGTTMSLEPALETEPIFSCHSTFCHLPKGPARGILLTPRAVKNARKHAANKHSRGRPSQMRAEERSPGPVTLPAAKRGQREGYLADGAKVTVKRGGSGVVRW